MNRASFAVRPVNQSMPDCPSSSDGVGSGLGCAVACGYGRYRTHRQLPRFRRLGRRNSRLAILPHLQKPRPTSSSATCGGVSALVTRLCPRRIDLLGPGDINAHVQLDESALRAPLGVSDPVTTGRTCRLEPGGVKGHRGGHHVLADDPRVRTHAGMTSPLPHASGASSGHPLHGDSILGALSREAPHRHPAGGLSAMAFRNRDAPKAASMRMPPDGTAMAFGLG